VNTPKTIKGWFQLAAAVAGLVVTLSGAAYGFHTTVAYKADVRKVENHTIASIKALRCDILDRRISELINKREAEGLTSRERARLENLLREWEQVCTNDG